MLRRRARPVPKPRSFELPDESAKSLRHPLAFAPGADPLHVEPVPKRDFYGGGEALPIGPVVERGEPIPAGIGCRKRPDSRALRAQPESNRSDLEVASDTERACRKLDEEASLPVKVLIASSFEPDARHRLVDSRLRWRGLNKEVEVFRLVDPARVDGRAGASRQDRPDAGLLQSLRNLSSDRGETRPRGQSQSRFPVLRGLRRSSPTRPRSRSSASVRRSR